MIDRRSKARDGFVRRLRVFLLQNFAPLWRAAESVPFLARRINSFMINTACNAAPMRPHPMSTLADYTSWTSLTDLSYFGRQLPPTSSPRTVPSVADATSLFIHTGPAPQVECPKSTLLFPVFAQYLTDGFLRTDPTNRSKTTSNHQIDMSPLYGRTQAQTAALRLNADDVGKRGRMKSQLINDEEFPPDLYQPGTSNLVKGFEVLDPPLGIDLEWAAGEHYKRRIFAVGGDRANATPMVSMLNTLLLREHNRLAGEIEARNRGWDDTRVFETTRNIVIAMYIKIVIEEYINHISAACFKLKADPSVAWAAKWNKPNGMTIEFALLYRWHSLIPENMVWNGRSVPSVKMLLDNTPIIDVGLAQGFLSTCQTNAAKLGLYNTTIFLEKFLTVESLAIQQNRDQKLDGYNAYRQCMGMNPVDSFTDMTGDSRRQNDLQRLYGSPDNVDFYVALFAEDVGTNTAMPPLLGSMVALDAFSQALTNPLLSKQVFNARTFTPFGMDMIAATSTVWDILSRNLQGKSASGLGSETVRITRKDWKRRFEGF